MNTALIGAQWGDEGKGKVIDILAAKADIVVRGSGGNNAGHTVVVDGKQFKLHLVPSGIMYPGKPCIIGAGCVVDPISLVTEMDEIRSGGITDFSGLKIDLRAHVVLPYHLLLDKLAEVARGKNSIGTTQKGIGPCYMDKAERIGLRIYDIAHPDLFAEKLKRNLAVKTKFINAMYGEVADEDKHMIDYTYIYNEVIKVAETLAPYFDDTTITLFEMSKDKSVLFEGAQGTLLDNDFGTYPFVTSSHPISGGFTIGCGVGPNTIDEVLGIAKAYTTRVGEGPFPTELFDETGEYIRKVGFEYGATTGRPRRCGWLDLVLLRYAVRINGLTGIALNKLDTLTGLDNLEVCLDNLEVCIGYMLDGKQISELPADISELERCTPVYKTLKGWHKDITGATCIADLPAETVDYVRFIEAETGCKVKMVGVGPQRNQSFDI